MTDDNMNRTHWVIATLIVIAIIATSIITPTQSKIKQQSSGISGITYVAPTN
ncbi:hypothetical protein D3C76_1865030 [compost metagenome]